MDGPKRLRDYLTPEQIAALPDVIPSVDPNSPYVIGYSGDPNGRLTPEEEEWTRKANERAHRAYADMMAEQNQSS